MKILRLSEVTEDVIINEAVLVLSLGKLLIFPTETCYGLGADPTNPLAITDILEYKGVRAGKPISVAVSDKEMAEKYVSLNDKALNLYKTHLPGPLTVISQSLNKVDKRIVSEKNTLGIRMPKYDLILKIVKAFGKPITATSANLSGNPSPYDIPSLLLTLDDQKQELIGLIIGAGTLPQNPPTTVIDTTVESEEIIRQGEIFKK